MQFVNSNVLCCRIDLQRQHIEYDLFFPELDIQFRYNVSGKILILPITGNGEGTIVTSELNWRASAALRLPNRTRASEAVACPPSRHYFLCFRLFTITSSALRSTIVSARASHWT
jgi:hypothetical protein